MLFEGMYWDELEVGMKVPTLRRPITEGDLVRYCQLTWNSSPLHNDKEWCFQHTPHRERLVPGPMTLGMTSGLEYLSDLIANQVIAQLAIDIKFAHGVFPGDSIQAEIEVLDKRVSASDPERGIIKLHEVVRNQDAEVVAEFTRTYLIKRRLREN